MKNETSLLSPGELVPMLEEKFKSDSSSAFYLSVTGNSMLPFLVSKRDTVVLTKPRGRLKKGDVAMFLRPGGAPVLHRVHRVGEDGYFFLGDSQKNLEGPVPFDKIAAECHTVVRKGKVITEKSFTWRFFRLLWPRIVPLRAYIIKVLSKLKLL